MNDKISDLIKIYDNAMPEELCQNFIKFYQNNQSLQSINGKERHDHLRQSRWTEIDLIKHLPREDLKQFSFMMLDFKRQYEQDCGMPALPAPQGFSDMRLKKYEVNQEDSFEVHYDNYGPASNRYLVFLWTLNDVKAGGETEFVDLNIKLKPEAGRLVVFPPYWMYRHKAHKVISESKYIINTFIVW